MTTIKPFRTRTEAEDSLVAIVENIMDYGKMSVKEVSDWIGSQKILTTNTITLSRDAWGWIKEEAIDFWVDKTKDGYQIQLTEPKLLESNAEKVLKQAVNSAGQEFEDTSIHDIFYLNGKLTIYNPEKHGEVHLITSYDYIRMSHGEMAEFDIFIEQYRKADIAAYEKEHQSAPPLLFNHDPNAKLTDADTQQLTGETVDELKARLLEGMKVGQGKKVLTKEGAFRESNEGRGRFDLIPYESLEALAIWSEQGAIKYGDRNWEAGLSVKDCINRLCRHAAKAASGWTDEDHLAAAMWNASAAITMMKRRPDCDDHTWVYPRGLRAATGAIDETIELRNGEGVLIKTFVGHELTEASEFTCPNCGGHNFTHGSVMGLCCNDCPWDEYKQHEEEMREWRQKEAVTRCNDMKFPEDYEKLQVNPYAIKEHECPFCGYKEPVSLWNKAPLNGHISIYTCIECTHTHEVDTDICHK